MSNYPATFHTYICRTIELSLANVRATAGLLPDAMRKQALHVLSYALGLDAAWPVTRELLLVMAPKMEQAGHRTDWMPYLEQGITAGERLGDCPAVAEYQLQLGMLYRMISQFETAKAWLTRSQANFAQAADGPNQARVLNELAWVEHLQRRQDEAKAYVEQVLSILPLSHPEHGMSYRILGMLAFEEGKLQEAELFHRQALEFFEREKDLRRIAWGLQNLATVLRDQNKFEIALQYYQKAAHILYEINDIYNWSIVQVNLGLAYFYWGKLDLALSHFFMAEDIAYKFSDTLHIAKIRTNQGLVYLALQDYQNAENTFRSAIEFYIKLGDEGRRLNATDGLAMAYLAQKQFTQAVEVLEAALQDLPRLKAMPNYAYLSKSLNEHLLQARAGQAP